MKIINLLIEQLVNIEDLVNSLNNHNYTKPCANLNNGTIGQHVRHALELLICLNEGYHTGEVNYDKRKRDKQIETDRHVCLKTIASLRILMFKPEKNLLLLQNETTEKITTSYTRELYYNIEHIIHHMALIRVALKELCINIANQNFGLAYSTIRFITS